MLDFDPDGLSGLSTVAGFLIATAVVALGIAVAAGATMLVAGRSNGLSRPQEKGLRVISIGAAGVMVLSSLGSGISWSIDQGQQALMPAQAQQQDIVVEREAPTTTCTQQAVRNFEEEPDAPSASDREAILNDIAGREVNYPWDADSEEEYITTIRWYPVGPDCSAENYTGAEATWIEWEARVRDGGVNRHQSGTTQLVTDERAPICAVEGTCEDNDD